MLPEDIAEAALALDEVQLEHPQPRRARRPRSTRQQMLARQVLVNHSKKRWFNLSSRVLLDEMEIHSGSSRGKRRYVGLRVDYLSLEFWLGAK